MLEWIVPLQPIVFVWSWSVWGLGQSPESHHLDHPKDSRQVQVPQATLPRYTLRLVHHQHPTTVGQTTVAEPPWSFW